MKTCVTSFAHGQRDAEWGMEDRNDFFIQALTCKGEAQVGMGLDACCGEDFLEDLA